MTRRAALVPLAFAAVAALRCSTGPGTVLVSGTGADDYYVADARGDKALTGSRKTNTPTELPAGSYVVVLNGSRAPARIRAGSRTDVAAGNLVVSGTGADDYHVADSLGGQALTGSRRTNTATELFPGTYTVVLNGSQRQVTLTAGTTTQAPAGNLLVRGTGADDYHVADSLGGRALTGSRRTNTATELLPGTFTVEVNGTEQRVTLTGGTTAEVAAGNLLVRGTGADDYHVADSLGGRALTGSRRTNTATELLPGTYTVVLNGSQERVTLAGGKTSEAPAGNVLVRGTGADDYYVADSLGGRALTGSRRTNTATELLPGSYAVRLRDRTFPVRVKAGAQSVVRP
jgi:hypothetical protein